MRTISEKFTKNSESGIELRRAGSLTAKTGVFTQKTGVICLDIMKDLCLNSDMNNFWTTNDLAKAARLTAAHIRHLIRAGQLRAEKIGRDYLIPAVEAKRFLASRKN